MGSRQELQQAGGAMGSHVLAIPDNLGEDPLEYQKAIQRQFERHLNGI